MKCSEEACEKIATRKIRTLDGIILPMCEHHAKVWIGIGCSLLPPLHIRLIIRKYAVSLVIALICSLITLGFVASISTTVENTTTYGYPYITMKTVKITEVEFETVYYWLNIAVNWLLFFATWVHPSLAVLTALEGKVRKWQM